MLFSALCLMGTSLFATQALAAPGLPARATDSAQVCFDGESSTLYCYTTANGATPQDVTVSDITFVASYLRSYGRQTRAGRLFTMPAAASPTCDEWTLYQHGSVLATAKHINDSVASSVLFEDIATTIDGGPNANDTQKASAIVGCLASGGSLGVLVNATNPAYSAATYKSAGYSTQGILVKIVASNA